MSKVLIANAYWYRLDPKQWAASQPYPPLGTLWAAAVLRNQGEMVSLHDTGLRRDPNEIAGDLNSIRPDIFVVYDDGFNYLTKMCLTVMREAAFVMIRHAHAMGIPVIVCSSDATDHDSLYFGQGADHVIHGEGEQTLMELVQCLKTGTDAGTVAGHSFVRDGKIHRTAPRLVMRDLDHLPMPAWDLVDIAPYRKIWLGSHRYFSLNLATTRGCPYKCNWCAKPIYGNRYNSRSPEKVAQEIAYLIDHFQPDHFWMADDIFGLKPGWIRQFQQACEDRKLKFRYKIQSRADLLEEPGTVEALALSGAETVWMGAESGSQKVLDAMDKGITVEQIRSSTIQLRSRGIRVGYFLQFGYPGETRSDIQSTLDLLSDLEPDEIGISVSYPLPGTVFYERVKSELKQKQNWSDSDDLSLMYRSTFSTAYYKALHRYVHSYFRLIRARRESAWKRPLRQFASRLYHILRKAWLHRQLNHLERPTLPLAAENASAAFSKQSAVFVAEDARNPVVPGWRQRIYKHALAVFPPSGNLLELNAGPGIDAAYFAERGFTVLATDAAPGMMAVLKERIGQAGLSNLVSGALIPFESLNQVDGQFTAVFSNFGGLNCSDDLHKVTRHLPGLLMPGARVCWVIMPRMAPWEMLWLFKGKWKHAFRRWRNSAPGHVEGIHFNVYYYSRAEIIRAFGPHFKLVRCEGLGIISPPPSATAFINRYPALAQWLEKIDRRISRVFPFNRWGDHLILTLEYQPSSVK